MINNKEIIFYCGNCHHKKITTDINQFQEHTIPSVPINYDKKTRKINSKSRRKQFKCPKCGYVIIPKFIKEQTTSDINTNSESENDRDDES